MKLDNNVKDFLNLIPALITINDRNHAVVWANDYVIETFGIEKDLYIGKSLETLFPNNFQQYIKENEDIFQTKRPIYGMADKVEFFGKELWTRTDKVPIIDEYTGEVDSILVFVRDITTHIFDIKNKVETQFKYKMLFHTSPYAIVVLDPKGKIVDCNEKFTELLFIPEINVIGKRFNDLNILSNEQIKEFNEIFSKILKDKIIEPVEINIHIGYNKEIHKYLEIFPSILKTGVEIDGIQVIINDITEKRKLEQEILKSQKLESLSLLSGGIAHDFNNILTAILGNISLAELMIDDPVELREFLNEAKNSILRARSLTQQLLTFSKGGAPIRKLTDPSKILDLITETTNFLLRGSKVIADFDFNDNLWPVEIDSDQISQVINNIVINAVQAMPNGGKIQICVKNFIATSRNVTHPILDGKYLLITIKDQGIGIPKRYLSKIFDPYFTTKEKGSGLGLATSYSIITKHKGFIFPESEPDMGTTFYIYIPALPEKKIPRADSKIEMIGGKGNVLVLDDDISILKTTSKILGKLGYNVDTVEKGSIAILKYTEKLQNGEKYDVIITDLTIPGDIGGKEVIERLLPIDPKVKAIVSSGYSNDPILSNYKEYGFTGLIAKPYKLESLSQEIKRVMDINLE